MNKKVLVVVDYQNDFASPEGALYVPQGETIAERIQREINNDMYDAIVYTMDTHIASDYEKSAEAEMFPLHCEYGTIGWDFFEIEPRNPEIKTVMKNKSCPKDIRIGNEYVFTKDVFDVWEGNINYENFIKTFDKDTEFIIVGVATNFCVKWNAMGCSNIGYNNVSVIWDAVKGIPTDEFEDDIAQMRANDITFIEGE